MTTKPIPRPDSPPPPTAQAEPYVQALGHEKALAFLLAFGGCELAIGKTARATSNYVHVIGLDGAAALAQVADRLPLRTPLANNWCAAMMHFQGHSVASIARTLRMTDVSIRKKLRLMAARKVRR